MQNTSTTDDKAVRQVRDALCRLNRSAARNVTIDVAAGVLTLRGPVETYYTKQVFVHRGSQLPGICAVVDELSVET